MAWARNAHGKLQVRHGSNSWIELNSQALEKFSRRTCNTQMCHMFFLNLCFWQYASAKRKNKARSAQMLWRLRFCHTDVALREGPEYSAFLCVVNISDKVQGANPNAKFAPSTSRVIAEGGSTIGCSSHFLRNISICLTSSKWKRERERETGKTYCMRMIKSYWDVLSLPSLNLVTQGPTCRPASAALVSASLCDRPWKKWRRLVETILRESISIWCWVYIKSSEKLQSTRWNFGSTEKQTLF